MKTGAPSLFREEYCDQLLEHCKDGSSFESFAANVGVSSATLYVWKKANPEFLEAADVAREHCRTFWEQKARECASGIKRKKQYTNAEGHVITEEEGNNNSGMIQFVLRNFFKDEWKDTQHVESENKVVEHFASEQETRDFLISKGIDPDA